MSGVVAGLTASLPQAPVAGFALPRPLPLPLVSKGF